VRVPIRLGSAIAVAAAGTGRLAPEDLSPQQRDEFVALYHRWRAEEE
jgi:hypothetical protein